MPLKRKRRGNLLDIHGGEDKKKKSEVNKKKTGYLVMIIQDFKRKQEKRKKKTPLVLLSVQENRMRNDPQNKKKRHLFHFCGEKSHCGFSALSSP